MKINQIKSYFQKVNPLNFKDERILSIKKLGTGESNLNFLIKTNKNKYLMRFDINNKFIKHFKQEYEILKKLESSDIAQKALFIDTSKRFFKDKFIIISYIEGKSLDKLSKANYSKHYSKFAIKLARLHELNLRIENQNYSFNKRIKATKRWINLLKKDLENFDQKQSIWGLFKTYEDNFNKKFKKYKPLLTFCHGDICLPNTLFRNKDFYLIDWEVAGNLDPALELSYHFYEFEYTEKQKDMFLKEYLKIRKDKTLKKRMRFTDFFVAFSIYFASLYACFNIAKRRGHKEYLKQADFKEYWEWANYYLGLICNLNLFDENFEKDLRKDLKKIYGKLKKKLK